VGGDGRASRLERFDGLILPHLTALYRAALRFTRTIPDAEDLVQETCLRALQNLDQLKQPEAAKAWVFAVLRSVYLRRAERGSASPVVSVDDLEAAALSRPDMAAASADSPFQWAVLEEVREATLRLPPVYREVLVLTHVGGFSYREMAQILEVPVGTVMSRLFRARRLLRSALQERTERSRRSESAR
jgi:RNA polymerase sigma-70 factor, ECF subfamily